jgi:hypothetical protein
MAAEPPSGTCTCQLKLFLAGGAANDEAVIQPTAIIASNHFRFRFIHTPFTFNRLEAIRREERRGRTDNTSFELNY